MTRSPFAYTSILFVLLLNLSVTISVSAQDQVNGSVIAGVITSGNGANPVKDALVTLLPLTIRHRANTSNNRPDSLAIDRATRTRVDGRYRFAGLTRGRYRLLVTAADFLPATFEVEVGSHTDLNLSAVLELKPIELQPLQDTTRVVSGRVSDATSDAPLANVEVTLEGTELRAITDAEGHYWLVAVPPGPQTIRTRRLGYAPNRVPITVPVSGTVTQDIVIAASALQVEGITVTGDAVSRATGELTTATVIELEAVRHQTATSIRGVLDLVPGVEAVSPGLDDIQQIALRVAPTSGATVGVVGTSSQSLAAFGTLIVLNDVPLSNNANLQAEGRGSEIYFTTNAGGGIDLREIPARTIERIEVIRGVPSARYGDLTQGAVVVETRAGAVDPELSVQVDERTAEVSMLAGHAFGGPDHAGTITLDFSRTRSAPGITEDAVYRFAGQLAHRASLGRAPAGARQLNRWVLDTRIDAFRLTDDRPQANNIQNRSLYNREAGVRVSERARLAVTPRFGLSFTGALSALQQRNHGTTPLTRGPTPFTDRITEGRSVGRYFLGDYVAETTMDGNPWLLFGRAEGEFDSHWLGLTHFWRTGLELRREWNTGAGYQFDILNPPQVTFNGVNGFARPRSNDVIPPLVTSALYLDNRLTRGLGSAGLISLQAGLRLDLLHEGSYWFSRVRDAELGPRINLEVSPWRWLRLRGGWGLVTKSPSLLQLHPDPQYYDVVNVNWFTNEPEERLAVLTTFIEDPTNQDLGFAVSEKAEAGFEIGLGRSAISLVAFRDKIRDGVAIRGTPGYILRDHYDLADSTRGTGRPPEILEPAAYSDTVPVLLEVPANIMTMSSRGLELTAVLPEISWLRTRLHVTGQWIETKSTVDALYFGSQSRFGGFALSSTQQRTPYWGPITETGERVLLMYRVINHQPRLGLVITAMIQHNVWDHMVDVGATDTLAFLGYLTRDAQLVPVPESDRGRDEYRDLRIARSGSLDTPRSTPSDWLLSIQVSKTFPLDGRLSFWAFNALDRRGIYGDSETRSRLYSSMRFGLELTMPVRELLGWAY
jgi:hypothetical protein